MLFLLYTLAGVLTAGAQSNVYDVRIGSFPERVQRAAEVTEPAVPSVPSENYILFCGLIMFFSCMVIVASSCARRDAETT